MVVSQRHLKGFFSQNHVPSLSCRWGFDPESHSQALWPVSPAVVDKIRLKLSEPWLFLSCLLLWPHFYRPSFLFRKNWSTKSRSYPIIIKHFLDVYSFSRYLLSTQYEPGTLRIQKWKYRQGFWRQGAYGQVEETHIKQINIHNFSSWEVLWRWVKGKIKIGRPDWAGGCPEEVTFGLERCYV